MYLSSMLTLKPNITLKGQFQITLAYSDSFDLYMQLLRVCECKLGKLHMQMSQKSRNITAPKSFVFSHPFKGLR